MPQKGLEKRGGVPSSPYGLRRDKLKGPFLKRAFSPPQVTTFIGYRAFFYFSGAGSFRSEKGAVPGTDYCREGFIFSKLMS